jgi:hypothetical protein
VWRIGDQGHDPVTATDSSRLQSIPNRCNVVPKPTGRQPVGEASRTQLIRSVFATLGTPAESSANSM